MFGVPVCKRATHRSACARRVTMVPDENRAGEAGQCKVLALRAEWYQNARRLAVNEELPRLGDELRPTIATSIFRLAGIVGNLQWWGDTTDYPEPPPFLPTGTWWALAASVAPNSERLAAIDARLEAIAASTRQSRRGAGTGERLAEVIAARDQAQDVLRAEVAASDPARRLLAAAQYRTVLTAVTAELSEDDWSNQGSLVIGVAALEVLMGDLIRAYVNRYPHALKGSDRKVSAVEVMRSASLDELRDLLVDEYVDGVIKKGLDQVRDWFGQQRVLDFDVTSCAPHGWESLREIHERRHVIIHNGGRVDNRYHGLYPSSPAVGHPLWIEGNYMPDALGDLLGCGAAMALSTWACLNTENSIDQAVCAVQLIHRVSMFSERYWDCWPAVSSVANSLQTIAQHAPVDDGARAGASLLASLWRQYTAALSDAYSNNGIPLQEAAAKWSVPGDHATSELVRASLVGDSERAVSLLDQARNERLFQYLHLTPLVAELPHLGQHLLTPPDEVVAACAPTLRSTLDPLARGYQ